MENAIYLLYNEYDYQGETGTECLVPYKNESMAILGLTNRILNLSFMGFNLDLYEKEIYTNNCGFNKDLVSEKLQKHETVSFCFLKENEEEWVTVNLVKLPVDSNIVTQKDLGE